LEAGSKDVKGGSTAIENARFGHDFGRLPVYPGTKAKAVAPEQHESGIHSDKSADAGDDSRFTIIQGKGPEGGQPPKKAGTPEPAPAPAHKTAAPKKTAGVDSFVVRWTKNSDAGPTIAELRLDYWAKFKKDDTHDPALADFRQDASYDFKITAGPNKGFASTRPMQDDGYSRADDLAGNTINDVNFASNDNPGTTRGITIDKNDVIDFSFTAEQTIVDTGEGDDWNGYKVIAKRGPHTATIKGSHPRKYENVPITLG
jgi:hypothetical protein